MLVEIRMCNSLQKVEDVDHDLVKAVLVTMAIAIKKSNPTRYAFKWNSPEDWPYEWRYAVCLRGTRHKIQVRMDQGDLVVGGRTRFELANPRVEEQVVEYVRQAFGKRLV